MKRFSFLLWVGVLSVSIVVPARAGDIRHSFANDARNSFYIDDRGGSVQNGGNNLSYYLSYKDVNESAFGTFLLYSKIGSAPSLVENGFDESFGAGDFINPSGIFLRPLSFLNSSFNGEIGLGSNSQLLPVAFEGAGSHLRVEQVSYTSAAPSDRWVIVEYRIVNTRTQPVQVKIGLANDFDVDQKSIDAAEGYTTTPSPMVYQQEGLPLDPNFTTVGVSLIEGTEAAHRMEICNGPLNSCAILANDSDASRKAFFEGLQDGDLTGGVAPEDYAVTLAADLGTLQPGEAKVAVFIYGVGQGISAANGLGNLQQAVSDGTIYYENNLQDCGNGLVNFGEQCDDGNSDNQDDCPSGLGATCQKARCGDGFLWTEGSGTEECDLGAGNSDTGTCTTQCKFPQCGDGFVQPSIGEQCDLGSANNDTGLCSTHCQIARCGDGFLQPGEVCDDGNNVSGDGCSADCKSIETCGNGLVDPPFEGCDDGNGNNNDACPDGPHGTCQPARCGDGFVFNGPGGSEQCDDGNNVDGDGCSSTCQLEGNGGGGPNGGKSPLPPPVCGNGVVETGEDCDNGSKNGAADDLCTTLCTFRPILQGGQSASPGSVKGCSLGLETSEVPNGSSLYFPLLGFFLLLSLRGISRKKMS